MTTPHPERRRYKPRAKTFLRAEIAHFDGQPIDECIAVDLSDTGARLFLPKSDNLPRQFLLKIGSRKISASCEVIHRQGETVGVKFVGPLAKR